MTTEELLRELSLKITTGEIRKEELMRRIGISPTVPEAYEQKGTSEKMHLSLTKILYVLGASIAILGIVFFVAQIWNDIGSWGRILVTLGLGFLIAGGGSVFLESKPESYVGQVFHAIGGFLIPGGALVTLYELGTPTDSLWPMTITIGIVFLFYLVLTVCHKNEVLTFFSFLNGTAFLYLLVTALLTEEGSLYFFADVYAYLTMLIGLSYILFAYAFRGGWNKNLVSILNFLGAAGFLGAAFSRVFESDLWELLFFLLAIGGMVLAVYIKSRGILVVSTCFLIGHFVYITSEYFADSIGWPISLVVLGFVIIGLGYMSITINKKYINGSTDAIV